jgi:hypothetical protein
LNHVDHVRESCMLSIAIMSRINKKKATPIKGQKI